MLAVKTTSTPRSYGATVYGWYVLSLAVCLVGNLLVRIGVRGGWLPPAGQMVLAVGSVVPLVIAAGMFWRLMKQELDEMLQRIVLEGIAFAMVIYIPLAALYLNVRTAGVWTPKLDPPDVVMIPAILVVLGIAMASRRYR